MCQTGERHLKPLTLPHDAVPRNDARERHAGRQLWPMGDAVSMEAPAPDHARRRGLKEAVNRTGSMASDQPKQYDSEKKERLYDGRLSGLLR